MSMRICVWKSKSDNYQNRRTSELRYSAENFAVRDLLDYIVKMNYLYPKERESYQAMRDDIDIEKIAREKQPNRQNNAVVDLTQELRFKTN